VVEIPAPTKSRFRFSVLTFEELHCTLVLLRRGSATEGAEIATTAGVWINLS
jgi:hypothetical protein